MQLSFTLERPPFLERIRFALLAQYGPQRDERRLDPISQLIFAMISGRTTDAVARSAYVRLECAYPSWDLLSRANPREVEDIIQPVTFAERKSAQIPRALRMIMARSGSLTLDFLIDWDEEAALQWLQMLSGVGPKVAAAVLNFSALRKRTFVVDTRLLRLGARLGVLPIDADYGCGHAAFARLIPDHWDADDLYEFHWLMKELSRRICIFPVPSCAKCPLQDFCPSARAMAGLVAGHQR
jgi:endonuclease-3